MAAPAVTSEPDTPLPTPSRRRRALPVLVRVVAALAGGGIFYASYPPRTDWYLAPLAFALLAAALRHRSARGGFLYGLCFGLAFTLPLLTWLQSFLGADFGPFPWVGLSFVVALYMALAGAAMATVSKLRGGPVWMAALFIGSEVLRENFPFDGFPWGKVAFGQPEGLFLPLASIGGTALLGFAVIVTGAGATELVARVRDGRRRRALVLPAALLVLPIAAGAASWSLVGTDAQAGTRTVAVIQGNAPDDGINLMYDTPILRRNHLAATEQLAADIKAGKVAKPDLVIWPEVVTDLDPDPTDDPELAKAIADVGVPFLIGGRLIQNPQTIQNVVQVWDPATGPGARYAKQKLVPFAEFIPLRSISAAVTPFVADTRDMIPGDKPGALPVDNTTVGVAICYEVAYDQVVGDAVRAGATMLAVPTNNAWYGPGEMSYQQLAMSRVAAVEYGRAVAVSATSGVSAIVQPDGSITRQSGLYTAATLVAKVPLRTTATLATRLGGWPERVASLAGLAALALAVGARLRHRAGSTT
ncbi:apolipoprotein N-acyltransferase [Kutzneria sp. NPDC052558]|uniref:apolipoprotein N-acyltransferase n=1 Tax=Kutzneria sp. NPDC052558 TaxID=3364121 RepID=UPI0037CB3441